MVSPLRPQDSSVPTHRRLRLQLTPAHLTTLVLHGGSVKVSRAMHMPLAASGGVVAHIPKARYRMAVKCVRAGRGWHLHMDPKDIAVSAAEVGGGFDDFLGKLQDFAKGALNVASKYILPAVNFALDLLPSSDPRVLLLKTCVKAVGEGAKELNKVVNGRDKAEEAAAQAQLEVAESEESLEDAKAAAKARDLSADARKKLLAAAAAAKKRVADKRAAAKKAEAAAAQKTKEAAALEKKQKGLKAKQKAAEAAAIAAAEKAGKTSGKGMSRAKKLGLIAAVV